MKNENQHLQKKLDSKNEKFVNLATILAEEYSKIPENSRLTLDLEVAENKANFNEFSNEERQAVFAILMNQIKPFIKRNERMRSILILFKLSSFSKDFFELLVSFMNFFKSVNWFRNQKFDLFLSFCIFQS